VVIEVELPRSEMIGTFQRYRQSRIVNGLVPTLPDFLDQFEPAIAPWTIITDIAPTTLRVRFFGTGMVSLMGTDTTGQYYALFLPEAARRKLFSSKLAASSWPSQKRRDRDSRTKSRHRRGFGSTGSSVRWWPRRARVGQPQLSHRQPQAHGHIPVALEQIYNSFGQARREQLVRATGIFFCGRRVGH